MGRHQTKHLQPLHDPRLLAWAEGIDKSLGGKKGLLGLEKLDAFDSNWFEQASYEIYERSRSVLDPFSAFMSTCYLT